MSSFKINIVFSCLIGCFFIISCENDLKDIEKISFRAVNLPVDTSKGVEVIFSDSAVVKGKLITPLLLFHKTVKPYNEMPKGLVVIFYDENQKESSRITADHGIRRENEKLVELRKNVVVKTQNGETFKSEELFWDETKKIFYSNQMVYVTKPDGTNFSGTQFQSDQQFENPTFKNAAGTLATGNKLTY